MHGALLDLAKGGGASGGGGTAAGLDVWLSDGAVNFLIPAAAIVGILFGIFMWWRVSQISVGGSGNREYLLEQGGSDEEVRFAGSCALSLSLSRGRFSRPAPRCAAPGCYCGRAGSRWHGRGQLHALARFSWPPRAVARHAAFRKRAHCPLPLVS